LADENANVGCPVGQLGDHWQRRSVTENGTRTTSWTCPGPTSATSDTWGGGFTYGAWTTTSNTCAAACVLPTPSTQVSTETRPATQTLACPAGQTGEIKQERQEQRTQTRAAYCPAPTGAYSWGAWSAWSAWTPTTAWVTTSNTCGPAGPGPGTVLWTCSYGNDSDYYLCRIEVNLPSGVSVSQWIENSDYYQNAVLATPATVCASGVADAVSYVSFSQGVCR
jgi:hypothetical protein